MVTAFVIEQLELFADERGIDDITVQLEESGALEGSLSDELESEMASNQDFEFTEEECVELLETMCDIEWVEDDEKTTSTTRKKKRRSDPFGSSPPVLPRAFLATRSRPPVESPDRRGTPDGMPPGDMDSIGPVVLLGT